MADKLNINTKNVDLLLVQYDKKAQKWGAQKSFTSSGSLKPLGSLETYIHGQLPQRDESHDDVFVGLEGSRKLASARPEMQPAIEVIAEDLGHNPPATGFSHRMSKQLVSIGEIQVIQGESNVSNGNEHQPLQVLALPTGPVADRVTLFQLRPAKTKLKNGPYEFVNTFSLSDSMSATWPGINESVRQVTFNHYLKPHTILLAILTTTSITLIRPVLSDSHLDIKTLLSIPTTPTFDFECTHLAFHPIEPQKLAAVGSRGEFTFWQVRLAKTKYNLVLVGSGRSPDTPDEADSSNPYFRDDGSRNIDWVNDGKIVIVCSPNNIKCWEASSLTYLGVWTNRDRQPPSRILTVNVLKHKSSNLVILTTSSVVVLRVNQQQSSVSFDTLIDWDHRRDKRDLNLRMALLEQPQRLNVVISSNNNDLVTSMSFSFVGFPNRALVGNDETCLKLHEQGIFNVLPLHLADDGSAKSRAVRFRGPAASFWQLFFLTLDLSLIGCLCCLQPKKVDTGRIENISAKRDKSSLQIMEVDDLRHVDKDDDSESGIDCVESRSSRISKATNRLSMYPSDPAFTVPRQMVYKRITSYDQESRGNGNQAWDGLINRMTTRQVYNFETLASLIPSISHLRDKVGTGLSIAQVMKQLNSYNSEIEVGPLNLAQIASPQALDLSQIGLPNTANPTLDSIYRQLIWIYNRPLKPSIRGIQRQRREKFTRDAAIWLFLASIGVQPSSMADDELDSQQVPASLGVEFSSSMSQSRPTSSNAVTQSVSRLQKLTQLDSPWANGKPQSESSEMGISEVLAHWNMQIDPDEYSYEATNALWTGESTVEGSAMSSTDRDRAARQEMRAKERLAARQARRQAAMQQQEDIAIPGPADLSALERKRKIPFGEIKTDSMNRNSQSSSFQPSQSQTPIAGRQHLDSHNDTQLNLQRDVRPHPKVAANSRLPERGRRPAKKPGF